MATLGTGIVTLADLAKQMEGDKVASVIEVLNKKNPILEDMPWVECNDSSGHIYTIRKGLPSPTWRAYNEGVAPTKSETTQARDTTGMLESWATCDRDLAKKSGNVNAFRFNEDKAHIEGMNQEFASTLFYGDTRLTPKKFFGFSPRFATPSSTDTEAGYHMINGGGEGEDNTSIWLIGWGPSAVHGIYPTGSKAGLVYENHGEQVDTDNNGKKMVSLVSHYKWDCGLAVPDWRYIVRIPNIDVSNLAGESAANLISLMIEASEMLQDDADCSPVWYCNRTVRTVLRNQILAKSNVNLSYDTVAGKRLLAFDEIPIKRTDAILNTEAAISFA